MIYIVYYKTSMKPTAESPIDDHGTNSLVLAVELLIAGFAVSGTRADRLALHHDLRPLAAKHPALAAAMRSLIEDRPAVERWRAYNRAEAAAAAWVERQGAGANP